MQSIIPPMPLLTMQPSLHHSSHMSSQFRGSKMTLNKPFASVAFIVVLLLQVFMPCSAVLYQVPLKQFKIPICVSTHRTDYSHIAERDVLSSMRNNLNGLSGDGYYIDVDMGTPPQKMQVLVDTGSANFAVACEFDPNVSHYFHLHNSSSFQKDGTQIYVPYTEGEWTGTLTRDVISIPSAQNLSATVNIACITESKAFFVADAEWQGILGLAYSELARPDSSYLPVWDSLLDENQDLENVFSMQLCGSSFVHTQKPLMEGSLVFGGVVPSMAKSALFYTPVYKQWYYEVVLTDIYVGDKPVDMHCKELNFDKTIVDSGTTNIRLPTKVFQAVVKLIEENIQENGLYLVDSPGPYFYSGDDVICYSDMARPFSVFPVVSFYLMQSENTSFRLDITPQHYLRPIESVEGDATLLNQSCVKFGFSPSSTGAVLGAVLLEAFYVIFDRRTSRIGFGQTTCPLPDPANPVLDVTIGGPFLSKKNLSECAYKKPEISEKTFLVVSYVMAALAVVVVLPLVMLFFMWTRKVARRREGYLDHEDGSETQTVLSDS